jgi:hypothetical protein
MKRREFIRLVGGAALGPEGMMAYKTLLFSGTNTGGSRVMCGTTSLPLKW